jgi:hypothetical protein
MIKGIVKYENDLAPGVVIYETTSDGVPLKRNNKYLQTTSDFNGSYSIDIPSSSNFYLTFQYINYKKTFATNNVPAVLNITSGVNLPEYEKTSSRTFYWLIPGALLLIYGIYKRYKK